MAGANSIFDGDKLLTTKNNDRNEDQAMFDMLGLRSRPAFLPYAAGNESSKSFEEGAGSSSSSCGGGCQSQQQQQQAAVGSA
jgi:biotin synthase